MKGDKTHVFRLNQIIWKQTELKNAASLQFVSIFYNREGNLNCGPLYDALSFLKVFGTIAWTLSKQLSGQWLINKPNTR